MKVQRSTQHLQCLYQVQTSQTMAIPTSTATLASIEAEEGTSIEGEEVVVEDQTPTLSILSHKTSTLIVKILTHKDLNLHIKVRIPILSIRQNTLGQLVRSVEKLVIMQ